MPEKQAPHLYPHDHIMKWAILPFIPEVIEPNHITVARFLLTPVVLWLLAAGVYTWAVPLFLLTAFTDVIDGSLARVRNKITPWGIFFDPLADKLLVGSVMLLVSIQYFHPALIFTALFLDMIPGLRWAFKKHNASGPLVMANVWGKIKMLLQCTAIAMLLVGITLQIPGLITLGEYTFGVATAFAVVAVITYSL